MSNRISDLEPDVQDLALEFLKRCKAAGLKVKVTQTRRTYSEQTALYAQGRTTAGPKVTAAPAGYSWHNFGRAFDIAEDDGTPYDIGPPGEGAEDKEFWRLAGEIGEALGFEWGGRWKHQDLPHFEHHGRFTLAALRDRVEAGDLIA